MEPSEALKYDFESYETCVMVFVDGPEETEWCKSVPSPPVIPFGDWLEEEME